MSRAYETIATLTIDGVEQDVRVRAHVEVERGFAGCMEATIDGCIQAYVVLPPSTVLAWVDVDYLENADVSHAEEALCDVALTDDTDADYRPRPFFGREGARYQ